MSGKVIVRGSYPRHVKTMQTGLDSHLNGILLKNSRDSHMHRHHIPHLFNFQNILFLFCYKDKNKVILIYYNQKIVFTSSPMHTQKTPKFLSCARYCLIMVVVILNTHRITFNLQKGLLSSSSNKPRLLKHRHIVICPKPCS